MFPCPRTVEEMALLTSASRDDLTRLVSIQELETKERAESNSVTFNVTASRGCSAAEVWPEPNSSTTHFYGIYFLLNFDIQFVRACASAREQQY
jgi:hypothetical protein